MRRGTRRRRLELDGEELGRPGVAGGYCMGSRHVAARIEAGELPVLARAELGIVLDMVGDADLRIPIEPESLRAHPALVERLWSTAEQLGHHAFVAEPSSVAIVDDHRFLTAAGIPSVLLIDHDYPPWHTRRDTIDQVSSQSLHAVGQTVLVTLERYWGAPPP